MADQHQTKKSRLAESSYNSPYSRAGAPTSHPNGDPYASLRTAALSSLEAMGYDPKTMVERGVLWAEDQDPFGHVMHSQFMHFLGTCFHRVMESYDEYLSEKEYDNMIHGKGVLPVIKKYELDIKRQVKYPDCLIAAYRQDQILPDRSNGTSSLFSLKQQAIVAEVKGYAAYIHASTGRPADIRTLGDGWQRLFEGLTQKAQDAQRRKETWDNEHGKTKGKSESSKM
ncbi:MAG: hypothetical protein Q9165_002324 [Trypethelium subeluteriae]